MYPFARRLRVSDMVIGLMRSMRTLLAVALLAGGGMAAIAQTFEDRLSVCVACHGEKGHSETAEVPSLGGQPNLYTLIQLFMFREKLRIATPMNEMTEGLSDNDLQKFADKVAAMTPPVPAEPPDPARAERAHNLVVQHRCAFCHRPDFSGADSVPRVAAQREDYLLKSLREYKSGARREYQPVMADIVRQLNEADIEDLAHFLARSPSP